MVSEILKVQSQCRVLLSDRHIMLNAERMVAKWQVWTSCSIAWKSGQETVSPRITETIGLVAAGLAVLSLESFPHQFTPWPKGQDYLTLRKRTSNMTNGCQQLFVKDAIWSLKKSVRPIVFNRSPCHDSHALCFLPFYFALFLLCIRSFAFFQRRLSATFWSNANRFRLFQRESIRVQSLLLQVRLSPCLHAAPTAPLSGFLRFAIVWNYFTESHTDSGVGAGGNPKSFDLSKTWGKNIGILKIYQQNHISFFWVYKRKFVMS